MVARSGIAVCNELKTAFSTANEAGSQTRYLIVGIDDEKLTLKKTVRKDGTWTADFNKVKSELTDEQPLYIIFWKDQASERAVFTGRTSGNNLHQKSKVLLMLFNPDDGAVRDKMVYASSWNAMKDLCGAAADEYQASTKNEFTYATFSKLREADDSLLSEAEKQLRETAIADPVSMEEAKEASGFNIIAMSKGHKTMPKIVQDSLNKAHQARTSGPSASAKRFKASDGLSESSSNGSLRSSEESLRNSSSPVAPLRNSGTPVALTSGAETGEHTVKPSQMKTWPPEKHVN